MNPLNAPAGGWKGRLICSGLMIGFTVSAGFADIAVLREKGPWSGSLFSNIGLLAEPDPPSKITMVSAEVTVRLRRGTDDQLAADCTADFTLEDRSGASEGLREFLVAFPVTGLNSKIVTVDNFEVRVRGEKPALVFRQAIAISRRQSELKDVSMHGRLDARFQVKSADSRWGVVLKDRSLYPNAYVWPQESAPGATTHVHVTYTATLRPQTLRYSKSYQSSPGDGEVIPFANVEVENWDEPYYFFDYVLMSGSTWDGPIGRETIKFTADPGLGLNLNRIQAGARDQVGYPQKPLDPEKTRAGLYDLESGSEPGSWTLQGKPDFDVLFTIPASALGKTTAEAEK